MSENKTTKGILYIVFGSILLLVLGFRTIQDLILYFKVLAVIYIVKGFSELIGDDE